MHTQQIRLHTPPSDRTKFLRALRLLGKPNLKQTVELANHLDNFRNSVVAAGLSAEVAAHIENELRAAGAEVSLEASAIDTPMLCCPAANQKFTWAFMRRIKRVFP